MPTMTGGQAVVATLKQEGVDTVFGIVSIHMLPIYDALYAEPSIRLIVPRHEMAGGFMADAYSRVSGRVGVYLTSTGPGAANSAGAVLEGWRASTRTLQLTGQIDTPYLDQGRGFIHEHPDQLGMFRALGAHTARIATPADAPPILGDAFHRLTTLRPRPTVVEMPIDQQYRELEVSLGQPRGRDVPDADPAALDEAADLLLRAQRPLIWVGGGVNRAQAHEPLRRLAEALGAAVFTTGGGRGALPDDHPLVVGNYFTDPAGRAFIEAADVVLAVGTCLSANPTHEWTLPLPTLIRLDIDPDALNHNYPATVGIAADAGPGLAELVARVEGRPNGVAESYGAEITTLRALVRDHLRHRAPRIAALMDAIRAATPRETIYVTDATLPAYTGGNQYLPVLGERGFVTTRGVAIGPGLPFALGAQAATPDRPVVCLAGDGGFMLHAPELTTAVEAKLPVIVCLFNNQGYGVLRRYQRTRFNERYIGVNLHTPDFVQLAQAMGARGERVTTADDLGAALRRALASACVTLIDIQAPFEE